MDTLYISQLIMTSAQTTFDTIIKTFPPETPVAIINQSLDGVLDIDLTTIGLPLLHTIRFETPGKLTRITIQDPQQKLKHLSAPNQELSGFDATLTSLETLDLTNNQLESIKITNKLPNVRVLRLGNNKLTQFREFPAQLEELWLNDNQLDALDLASLTQLREIHVERNNPAFYLLNVPASVKTMTNDAATSGQTTYSDRPVQEYTHSYSPSPESSTDNGGLLDEVFGSLTPENPAPIAEIDIAEMRADYDRAIHKYFSLKQQYEKKIADDKAKLMRGSTNKKKEGIAKAKSYVAKCIKCKQPGGTVFRRTVVDGTYTHEIFCGNTTQPCPLKVVLQRGNVSNFEYFMDAMSEMLEEKKSGIIQHKLDTLFQYISESRAVEQFKVLLDEYNIHAKEYKTDIDVYTDLHFSEHKSELVRDKLKKIYDLKLSMRDMTEEYVNTENKKILQSVAKMYISDYLPEIDALRRLNYEVMELNDITRLSKQSYYNSNNEQSANPVQQVQLFQMDVSFKKREDVYSNLREKVVEFNI